MLVLVEISDDVVFDNNRQIELELPITVPVKVIKYKHLCDIEDLTLNLDVLESIIEFMNDKDLDAHDKEAYSLKELERLK